MTVGAMNDDECIRGSRCNPRMHTGIDLDPRMHTGMRKSPYAYGD